MLNYLCLLIIVIYIIVLSGAIDDLVKPLVKRVLGIRKDANITLGPLDCGKCSVFWSSLLYFLIIGKFTLYTIAVSCIASYLEPTIETILIIVKDLITKLLSFIYNKI